MRGPSLDGLDVEVSGRGILGSRFEATNLQTINAETWSKYSELGLSKDAGEFPFFLGFLVSRFANEYCYSYVGRHFIVCIQVRVPLAKSQAN